MIDFAVLGSGSKGNCYALHDGQTSLLLECGIPFKQIQRILNFQASSFDGVLISHSHKDHCGAARDCLKAGLELYASKETLEAFGWSSHRFNTVEPLKKFQLKTWAILPFSTKHDCEGSLGFLLANKTGEKLLYATDTAYLHYRFKDISHLAIECNHSSEILSEKVTAGITPRAVRNRVIASHFSLDNLKRFLQAMDANCLKEIHLLHLSDSNADAGRFKLEIQQVVGCEVYIA